MNETQAFYIFHKGKRSGPLPGEFVFNSSTGERYILLPDDYSINKGDVITKDDFQAAQSGAQPYNNKFYVVNVVRISDMYRSTRKLKVYYQTEHEYKKSRRLQINDCISISIALLSLIVAIVSLIYNMI